VGRPPSRAWEAGKRGDDPGVPAGWSTAGGGWGCDDEGHAPSAMSKTTGGRRDVSSRRGSMPDPRSGRGRAIPGTFWSLAGDRAVGPRESSPWSRACTLENLEGGRWVFPPTGPGAQEGPRVVSTRNDGRAVDEITGRQMDTDTPRRKASCRNPRHGRHCMAPFSGATAAYSGQPPRLAHGPPTNSAQLGCGFRDQATHSGPGAGGPRGEDRTRTGRPQSS